MTQVCRTCLKIIENNSQVFSIEFKDPTLDNVHIKAKLEACVPEIELNRVKNSVICNYCLNALNSAYAFKIKCLESEKKIFRFITCSTMSCIDLTNFITKFTNNYYNQSNGNYEGLQRQFNQSPNQPFVPHPSLLPTSFTKPNKLLHPRIDYTGKLLNPPISSYQMTPKSLPLPYYPASPPITPSKPYLQTSWPNHVNTRDILTESRLKAIQETPKVPTSQQQSMSMLYNNFTQSRTPELPFMSQSNREMPPLVALESSTQLQTVPEPMSKPQKQQTLSSQLRTSETPLLTVANCSQPTSQPSSLTSVEKPSTKIEPSSPTQPCVASSTIPTNGLAGLEQPSAVNYRNSVTPKSTTSCEVDSTAVDISVQQLEQPQSHQTSQVQQTPFQSSTTCQLDQSCLQPPFRSPSQLEQPSTQRLQPPFQSPTNCQLEQPCLQFSFQSPTQREQSSAQKPQRLFHPATNSQLEPPFRSPSQLDHSSAQRLQSFFQSPTNSQLEQPLFRSSSQFEQPSAQKSQGLQSPFQSPTNSQVEQPCLRSPFQTSSQLEQPSTQKSLGLQSPTNCQLEQPSVRKSQTLQPPFQSSTNSQLEQPAMQKSQPLEPSFQPPTNCKLEMPLFRPPSNCQLEQPLPRQRSLFNSSPNCQVDASHQKASHSKTPPSFNVPQPAPQTSEILPEFPAIQIRSNSSLFDLPLQHEPRVSPLQRSLNSINSLLGNSEFNPTMAMNGPEQFFPPTQRQVYPPFAHFRPQSNRFANQGSFNSQANHLVQQASNFPIFQENQPFRSQLPQYPGPRFQNSPSQYQPYLPNPFPMSQHYRSSISPYPSPSSIQPTYQQGRRSDYSMNHRSPLANGPFGLSNHYRSSLAHSPRMALHYQNPHYGTNRPDYQTSRGASPPQSNLVSSLNSSSSSSSLHSSPSPSATSHYPAPPLFHSAPRPSLSLLRSCLASFQSKQSSHRLPTSTSPPLFPHMFGPNQELNGVRMKLPNSFMYHFTNNKEPLHSCAICRAGFSTLELLQEHSVIHESLKCASCDFQTNLNDAFHEHSLIHKPATEEPEKPEVIETVYNCNQCEFNTTNKASFEEHRFKHEPVVYKCQICNFKSIHASSLRRHKKIHMNEKEFKCRRCDVVCEKYEDLVGHMTNVHTEENSDGEAKDDKQVDPYQVSIDDIQNIIEDENDLMDEGEQSDAVVEQDEMFDDVDSYMITAADLEKILNEDKGESDSEMVDGQGEPKGDSSEVKTIFNCKVCQQPFQFKYQLKKHMIIHSMAKQILECQMCEYRTTTKSHLQVHMNTHTGGTIYKCEQCDYSSVYWSNVEKHNRVHTGEKPYKCDYCDYSVTKMSRLRNHLETHAKQKLYKCKECSFEADSEDNLLNHKVIHNYGKHFLQDQVGVEEGVLGVCEVEQEDRMSVTEEDADSQLQSEASASREQSSEGEAADSQLQVESSASREQFSEGELADSQLQAESSASMEQFNEKEYLELQDLAGSAQGAAEAESFEMGLEEVESLAKGLEEVEGQVCLIPDQADACGTAETHNNVIENHIQCVNNSAEPRQEEVKIYSYHAGALTNPNGSQLPALPKQANQISITQEQIISNI